MHKQDRVLKQLAGDGISLWKVPALHPMFFFRKSLDVPKNKKVEISSETKNQIGTLYVKWDLEGIWIEAHFLKPFSSAHYPEYQKGEAVELWIDTRDSKESSYPTQFCHHFLILPKEVNGISALELSRFRYEDKHEICNPQQIFVKIDFAKKGFIVKIGLPKEILHGYDPMIFQRMGFAYALHTQDLGVEQFPIPKQAVAIGKYPKYWSTIRLI